MYGSTGSMMSILAGKANSFVVDIAFSADCKDYHFCPEKIVNPPDCKALIEKLKSCDHDELLEELSKIKTWNCGKTGCGMKGFSSVQAPEDQRRLKA
ncbi:hypothetical protein TNCV_36431 [Trichonephila clavipes]|nr:hypothetical protein TNCV_36431 [Trichonephila clavipes]